MHPRLRRHRMPVLPPGPLHCGKRKSALANCREPEPDALQQCMLAYAGTVAGCDAGCTHAFCKCMEDARADAKTGAGAIGNGLIIDVETKFYCTFCHTMDVYLIY